MGCGGSVCVEGVEARGYCARLCELDRCREGVNKVCLVECEEEQEYVRDCTSISLRLLK